MRGYKYVKFSRGTARDNPQMIIREYKRLITAYETTLDVKQFKVKAGLSFHYTPPTTILDIPRDIEVCGVDGSMYPGDHIVTLMFNFKDLSKLLKEVASKEVELNRAEEHLDAINLELAKFMRKFL